MIVFFKSGSHQDSKPPRKSFFFFNQPLMAK